jgi:hypothetical protein
MVREIMGEVWRSGEGRKLLWICGIGIGAFILDEILGAIGKGQYKTPLNVGAFFVCLKLGLDLLWPVLDGLGKVLGLQ